MARDKRISLDRTLEIASELLIQADGDDPSITEIARSAHCSTATIYEAYNSKEELFYQAVVLSEQNSGFPQIGEASSSHEALDVLLNYLCRRIAFLNSRRCRGAMLAYLKRGARARALGKELEAQRNELPVMVKIVEGAMDDGKIRRGDPSNVAFCIAAAVSFEPLLSNVLRDEEIAVEDVIEQALEPFLTKGGLKQLQAFLQKKIPPASSLRPRESHRSWLKRNASADRADSEAKRN